MGRGDNLSFIFYLSIVTLIMKVIFAMVRRCNSFLQYLISFSFDGEKSHV